MEIYVHNSQSDLNVSEEDARKVVHYVLSAEKCKCDEVNVNFVTTEEICDLHDELFSDPSPTDCISIPIDTPGEDEYCLLGEIYVCPKTALNYSIENNQDPYKETTLYVVHALLHLLGYDDVGEAEPVMRAAELRHMTQLEKMNLLIKRIHS